MSAHRPEPAGQLVVLFDLTDFLIDSLRHRERRLEFVIAATPDELLAHVSREKPAIILLDPRSAKSPGAFVARVAHASGGAPIAVLTDIDDDAELRAMLRARVCCLLRRTHTNVGRFVGAVRAMLSGSDSLVIDYKTHDALLAAGRSLRARLPAPAFEPDEDDLAALKHAIRSLPQREAAAALYDGRTKYQSRLRALCRRTGARSTAELAVFAERMGWLDDLELPGEQ